jgi:DNA-binding beta-propeller fold protein YncE
MKNRLLLVTLFFVICTSLPLPNNTYGVSAMTGSAASSSLELVATITLERRPESIAVNEATNLVYVGTNRSLVVIDGETNEIIADVPLGESEKWVVGESVVVNPQTNRIYAQGIRDESLCIKVIDGATHEVVGEIPESPTEAWEIAVNQATNLLYITDTTTIQGRADYLHVYDGETLELVTSIEIPGSRELYYVQHAGVAVNPETNRIYVTWTYQGQIFVIDGNTHNIINNTEPASYSTKIRVNPSTNYLYLSEVVLDGETLDEVDTTYEGGLGAINPSANLLYVTKHPNLYVLDGTTHTMGPALQLDEVVKDLAVNPQTGRIYATHWSEQEVSVVQGPLSLQPANFVISHLAIEPTEVDAGTPFTITVNVTNTGDLVGQYDVELEVAGEIVDTEGVVLKGGKSRTVTFELSEEDPGTYTITVNGQTGSVTVKQSGCFIATATYGSELSPPVNFLRRFRDEAVLSTFAGSSFMTVFNTWYYSFSAEVASLVARNEPIRGVMKVLLSPMIGSLRVCSAVFSFLSFSPELGILIAGLVASVLLAIVYVLPVGLLCSFLTRSSPPKTIMTWTSRVWVGSLISILVAEASTSPLLMMTSTGIWVLATIWLTALVVMRTIMKRALTLIA